MGLTEALPDGPVALDSCVFIYFIEDHPRFAPQLQPLFEEIDAGRRAAVASELTLLETLVVPYRNGRRDLAEAYERHLTRGRGLGMRPVDRGILRAAALLRASAGMRAPDAIHVATAVAASASAFLTNDRDIPAIPGITILQLEELAT